MSSSDLMPGTLDYSLYQSYCGVHCLYIAGKIEGYNPSYLDIIHLLHPDKVKGVSMQGIEAFLTAHQWSYKIIRCSPRQLSERMADCTAISYDGEIASAKVGHFYLERPILEKWLQVIDPPRPPFVVTDPTDKAIPMILIYGKGKPPVTPIPLMQWIGCGMVFLSLLLMAYGFNSLRNKAVCRRR